jgi:GNAT superfamily N-acetyltransferase
MARPDQRSGPGSDASCDIVHFRTGHEAQVVDLLTSLWKHDRATRARLFRWKYLDNPSSDRVLGIVALHGDRVVGFRGYFANRYVLNGHDRDIVVLHPGDTCVDPAYRMLGLSVAMGKKAAEYDRSKYRLLMNMTCSPNSLPGYLKLGFRPLVDKELLTRYDRGTLGWLMCRLARNRRPPNRPRIQLGQFGNVLVTASPRPADMAMVIGKERQTIRALRPRQDAAFFVWRYANPAHRYVFYFLVHDDAVRGYVVADVLPDNRSGEILDYGERDDGALGELMSFIATRGHFAALSIFRYGVDERMAQALQRLGFSTTNPLQRLVGSFRSARVSALPLLIRPVGSSPVEQDFVIDGVDLRSPASWRLKPICSDAA